MKPNHSVPLMVASGLAAPLPGVPVKALISTSAMTMSVSAQNTGPEAGRFKGRREAAPMKKSMGMEKTTLVRDARPPRAPAAAAAGLAGLSAAPPPAHVHTHLFLGPHSDRTI